MNFRRTFVDKKEYFLLFGILSIAFALRIATARFDLLLGADPWRHFHLAEELLKSGRFPGFDYYVYYPRGGEISTPVGLYYLPVLVYSIGRFFGISFFKILMFLPPFFGTMSIILLYLIIDQLYNKRIAIFSVLLYSTSPAAIERSLAGYYRGDVFFIFAMLLAIYFFLLAINIKLYFSVISAFFIFISSLLWNGWPFIFVIFSMFGIFVMIVNYFKNKSSNKIIITYLISSWLGLALIYFYKLHYFHFTHNWGVFIREMTYVFYLLLFTTSILGLGLLPRFLKWKSGQKILFLVSLLGITTIVIYYFGILSFIEIFFKRIINWSTATSPSVYSQNITEMQRPTFSYLVQILSILAIISPIGFLLLFKKLNFKNIFSIAFISCSFLIIFPIVRFTFLAAPALAIAGGVFLSYFLDYKRKKNLIKGLIVILIMVNTLGAIAYATNATPFVSSELYKALSWTRDNTSPDSVIATWWHYTGPVHGIANRRTIELSTPTAGATARWVTALATSDEKKAFEIISEKRADLLLIDSGMLELWPNILRYSTDENKLWERSMLYRMYINEDLDQFKLIYSNTEVKIFELVQNYTRINTVKTDQYFYKSNDEIEITIKTISNKIDMGILNVSIEYIGDPGYPQGRKIFEDGYPIRLNDQTNVKFKTPKGLASGMYQIHSYLYDNNENYIDSYHIPFGVI